MFLGFTLPTPLSPTATTLREMQTSKFESLTIVAPPLLSPPFYYRAVQLTFQKFRQGVFTRYYSNRGVSCSFRRVPSILSEVTFRGPDLEILGTGSWI